MARISPATRDSVLTSQPAMFDAMMQALRSISRYGSGSVIIHVLFVPNQGCLPGHIAASLL